VKLRTKFLISLCAILFLFGCATVQVVQRICQIQIRQILLGDLQNSVITFRSFENERNDHLMTTSELIANMPALKALMTTEDAATIQDGSAQLWRLAGSELFVLSDRNGKVVAVHSSVCAVRNEAVHLALDTSMKNPKQRGWSFVAGHLFENVSEPIYFGPPSDSHLLGLVTVGYEINDKVTRRVADIAASQVAFQYGDTIVSSTLPPNQIDPVPKSILGGPSSEPEPSEAKIDGERFLATSLALTDSPKPTRLIVLKSFDQASLFLQRVNRIVIAMNVIAIVIGCGLVLLLCRKFTRPLDELLEGVRALEHRNFSYPLTSSGNDEIAELTRSFDDMRSSLAAAEDKLLKAEQSATIGRMASSISHDLRHRLTAIIANAEFLAESDLSLVRKQELYENVSIAVRKMTDVLESLLEFSRTPDSLRLEYLPVQEIVEDSIATIRLHPQFQSLPISIESTAMVYGWFDPKALERGLYNLLLNACEMVSPESGKIVIAIQQMETMVEVRISDNGPGIADCIREKLFQPFVSYGKQHGSGLGLAIVQKTCLDHRGKLLLEHSSPGFTTLLMLLPLGATLPPIISTEVPNDEVAYGVPYVS
jgi:signal transduction histidine kinase